MIWVVVAGLSMNVLLIKGVDQVSGMILLVVGRVGMA